MAFRVRQALAVALVATALASERSLAVAASQRVDRTPESKSLVTRLTQQLRRVVVGASSPLLAREDRFVTVTRVFVVLNQKTLGCASRLNVMQLHLPPPLA